MVIRCKYWVFILSFILVSCGENNIKDEKGYTLFYLVYQKNGLLERKKAVLSEFEKRRVIAILEKRGDSYKFMDNKLYVKPPEVYGTLEPLDTYMWDISSDMVDK